MERCLSRYFHKETHRSAFLPSPSSRNFALKFDGGGVLSCVLLGVVHTSYSQSSRILSVCGYDFDVSTSRKRKGTVVEATFFSCAACCYHAAATRCDEAFARRFCCWPRFLRAICMHACVLHIVSRCFCCIHRRMPVHPFAVRADSLAYRDKSSVVTNYEKAEIHIAHTTARRKYMPAALQR